ncbi:type 3 dihydrofolate reductase [Vibrio ostreae]|uniref:Dihydrofolate reductase n=1 Tax=Vibrio ostreae TaxID=2841925 RepID=A0A975UCW3_9VIBR|nr:type 3 dihydrofolate reductase [Vibrio ostreae]QXO19370.1 type 3 dihydrofolate reductase [Vibrio ostreae]
MVISMIAALARNGNIERDNPHVIGNDNEMPWHLPADFIWFKQHTLGKPVIMGRKTYESIGKPLPGRRNIVITRNPEYSAEGVTIVPSLEIALAEAGDADEAMIIGGGSIYNEALPKASKLYLTFIDAEISGDTYFPEWDSSWTETHREHYRADEKNQYDMDFVVLEKI